MDNWIYRDFKNIFIKKTGVTMLEDDELIFLSKFTDVEKDSPNKIIYYNALFRFKRWYPKKIVYYLVFLEYIYVFYKNKAPKSIKKLVKDFAFYTYFSALKAYSKNSDLIKVN
jgi:hypothetical protein